jgi:thioredoxin-related protein
MFVRQLLIFAFSVLGLSVVARAQAAPVDGSKETVPSDSIVWVDYARGVETAKAENKPMLVFFYRDTCPYCRKLRETALTDTTLAEYLNANFIPIRVSTESRRLVVLDSLQLTEAQLANENWKIRGVPAMWLLEPNGCRVKKLVGLKACSEVLTSLKEIAEHTYGDCPDLPLAKPKVAPAPDSTSKSN